MGARHRASTTKGGNILSQKKQINKMGVKKQTDKKVEPKKKVVSKLLVWECLICSRKEISEVKPEKCSCSNPNFVINNQYTVGD